MDKGYKNRVSRNTRDDLDSMIDRGMRQLERKAILSSGWKKAGIAAGISTIGIGAIFGMVYLAKSITPRPAQLSVNENNGSIYSSLVMVNGNKEADGPIETIEKQITPEYSATEEVSEWPGLLPWMFNTMENVMGIHFVYEDNKPEASKAAFEDSTYTTTPTIIPTIEAEPSLPAETIGADEGYSITPETQPTQVQIIRTETAPQPEPEDMFTIGLSEASLYNGNYDDLITNIHSISNGSGTIYYAQLHDENNTLVVEYVGAGYPETFQVEEAVIDSLISKTLGYREESIHIGRTELERLLEKNDSNIGAFATQISQYCSGDKSPDIIESYLRDAQLVNFVPRNGDFPMINIILPLEVYTFYAKGNENMQTLMDLSYIPK